MSTDLKSRVAEDTKSAMRAHDKAGLSVLRLLSAEVRQREIDGATALDDAGVVSVIQKMIKQRRDSIAQYEAGHRPELAAAEAAEIERLSAYLPKQLTPEEVNALIAEALQSTGATDARGIGKVMGWLKPKLAGRADLGVVSKQVREHLASPRD
ncbi:MAG TPA: GatB/YqeY domain-containing protein [Nevskiaceae bacterium]